MGLNIIGGENRSSGGRRNNCIGQLPEQVVCIYTMGRFGIRIDGLTLPTVQLRQQKPVELLQALIAFGGRGVNKEVLSGSVWPDAEGDDAANSFDVTLHRLRKLLKHDGALLAANGRLTLNSETVWVDVWILERMLNRIDRLLTLPLSKAVSERVTNLLKQAMTLYQGGFLAVEAPKPWGLSLRERIRSKLMRAVIEVARQAERNGQWNLAALLHQKGLEMDPLYELFYQRLMVCHRESGRKAEALAVYQRCCANLLTGLCIKPSSETDRIRDSLM